MIKKVQLHLGEYYNLLGSLSFNHAIFLCAFWRLNKKAAHVKSSCQLIQTHSYETMILNIPFSYLLSLLTKSETQIYNWRAKVNSQYNTSFQATWPYCWKEPTNWRQNRTRHQNPTTRLTKLHIMSIHRLGFTKTPNLN